MSRSRWQDLILPIGIISSVLVILVPLPLMLMDVLLAANITIAVIVLLTTIYVRTPLEFSIFPSLLLATTLGRLVLNVATTRLILSRAAKHDLDAAGGVIKSFGEFVTGDSIIIGLIIFVIIVVIQFIVITKGATRISEVAARFALDGMPGRQMAIDADLNAGMIDEREAQSRRNEITQQAARIDCARALRANPADRASSRWACLAVDWSLSNNFEISVAEFSMNWTFSRVDLP